MTLLLLILPLITTTSVQRPLFWVPKVAVVVRFDSNFKSYKAGLVQKNQKRYFRFLFIIFIDSFKNHIFLLKYIQVPLNNNISIAFNQEVWRFREILGSAAARTLGSATG